MLPMWLEYACGMQLVDDPLSIVCFWKYSDGFRVHVLNGIT